MDKITVDEAEINKFAALSNKWWDPLGEFRSLHEINPLRIEFIKSNVLKNCDIQTNGIFHGLDILDIGCGGGLLSEPLSRLGANMTSIDPVEENIYTAMYHAKQKNLQINYRVATIEELSLEEKKFDIVLNLEVVEHVNNVEFFIEKSCSLLKKNGLMFLSTISRTIKSYLLAIIAAEYILKWVPKKTHHWEKFLFPHEIERMLRENDFKTLEFKGIEFDLFQQNWKLSENLDVNYMLVAKKC